MEPLALLQHKMVKVETSEEMFNAFEAEQKASN